MQETARQARACAKRNKGGPRGGLPAITACLCVANLMGSKTFSLINHHGKIQTRRKNTTTCSDFQSRWENKCTEWQGNVHQSIEAFECSLHVTTDLKWNFINRTMHAQTETTQNTITTLVLFAAEQQHQ